MCPGDIPEKRRLKVDMDGLEEGFENSSYELSFYLDLETGEVVVVTYEVRRVLEDIYEDLPEEEAEVGEALNAAADQHDLPDWEKEQLMTAYQVDTGFGERFIQVPRSDSHESYRDMEDFIDSVSDQRLASRLDDAIQGKGAFRRFKDTLYYKEAEQARWYEFRERRLRERVLKWLEEEGIEPILDQS